ncbi:hypothetical protein CHLNCDRAFT_136692 [Chlorella variabilis]|uniref:SBP-type domain-containing protein n=1 Tax=Chlorella variabilis TaxID=554065 RepID=E1ZKU9_CHLVA|nr:hypothetical protein CHLNCDRAFT_136692 [Chlorella variabilis]EFN53442.1 hypothetical protein CHLNCDRAFT_136692 [Chlorella variabilis]|eukprot:XP_005845544.1 hypothetical protein CHLNCDRAFT_136692 [Chlorella variabilis]
MVETPGGDVPFELDTLAADPATTEHHNNASEPSLATSGSHGEDGASCGSNPSSRQRGKQPHRRQCRIPGCGGRLAASYNMKYCICNRCREQKVLDVHGVPHRWCQQCSKLHGLEAFEDARRSCKGSLLRHQQLRWASSRRATGGAAEEAQEQRRARSPQARPPPLPQLPPQLVQLAPSPWALLPPTPPPLAVAPASALHRQAGAPPRAPDLQLAHLALQQLEADMPDTLWVPSAAQLDHFNSQMGFQLEASFATPPPALPPSLPPLALRGSTAAGSSGNASGCAAPAHTPLPTVVQALFIGGEQAWPLAPGIAGLACAGQAQRLMHPGLITRKNGKTYRALP